MDDGMIRDRTVAVSGLQLHVVEAGPPRGPLVLLLHGFPEFWYGWRKQLPFLARKGCRVWAPDQRGYNLSDKPRRVADYDVDRLADDVLGIIEAARRRRAVLIGHDWGGLVAWWTALRDPQAVERLVVLNAPHPAVLRRHLGTNARQMLRSWYAAAFQLPALPELALGAGHSALAARMLRAAGPRAFDAGDIGRYREAWERPGAWSGMVNWYRAAGRRGRKPIPGPRVRVPTLLLWGARDVALGRELAGASIELCDDGQLVAIETAGHFVQHEAPARVNRAIARFLSLRGREGRL